MRARRHRSDRNSSTSRTNTSGVSRSGKWPPPSMVTTFFLRIAGAARSIAAYVTFWSAVPCRTSVGAAITG